MQRRRFLQWSAAGAMVAGVGRSLKAEGETGSIAGLTPDGRRHHFSFGRQQFLLDGQAFQIRSGEMHPIRIPAEYWLQRIRMAKAMGLNTIAIYLMWNALEPEPGQFDLHSGSRDFVHFIELCQQEGMWVYLRPGPYVCAEWDFGGLPSWLLRHPDIQLRTGSDPIYREAVLRYLDVIAPRIRPLLASEGGPILMLQVENEYASFGADLGYLEWLRAEWQARGVHGPFSISDGLSAVQQKHTYLPGAALGLDGDTDFAAGQKLAGDAPVWVGEGYPGWLTHWGDATFQAADYAPTLQKLLAAGRSFNLYVVHGGTNFGFGAGANAEADGSKFQPVLTSYDYGAPIDERGGATAQYHRMRQLIGAQLGHSLPDLPPQPAAFGFDRIELKPWASLWDHLGAAHQVDAAMANEYLLGQGQGLVVYRKQLAVGQGRQLQLEQMHDYATVHQDGHYLGYVSRVQAKGLAPGQTVTLAPDGGRLDILVDSFGHVGYGQDMHDRKGLLASPQLDGKALDGWTVYGLPLDAAWLQGLQAATTALEQPGIVFSGALQLEHIADTYLDMSEWDKGYVWVNGRLLGRYWRIGPQQRLYCPASWLTAGHNEILVLDLHRLEPAGIRGVETLHA
ncbi:beta-galactosidase [Frateuria aurantia]